MKDSLQPGISHVLDYLVPPSKTVPNLYPNIDEYQAMPEVFATGFFVGLVELACIRAVNPHIDWPAEQTVGTHVDLSHSAPTPPGMEVTVSAELTRKNGRQLVFDVDARDESETIGNGQHERFVVDREQFQADANRKSER